MKTSLPCPTEEIEARLLHEWLTLKKIPHHHVANESYGGTRADMLRGAKLKLMGRSRGYVDYLIFIPKQWRASGFTNVDRINFVKFGGLTPNELSSFECNCSLLRIAVELKRQKGGIISKEQTEWIKIERAAGTPTAVCHGFEEAKKFVERFL